MDKAKDYNLLHVVMENSEHNDWQDAVQEWEIEDCQEDDNQEESCICGKEHLKYLFTIKNKNNGKVLTPIGSSCIKKFEREELDELTSINKKLFELLHAMEKNKYIRLDNEFFTRKLLTYLYKEGAFTTNKYGTAKGSYEFIVKMFNKKKDPTPKQDKKVKAIIMNDIRPFLKRILKDKIK
ncbi:hypothetical protein HB999_14470 [Listeria booriae]|uniref:hypothetical protein n=1 Tax=Listeria booriae TaxID=1552123 RepID=UPI00164E0823|nr:hypothetical protein [Listeria booriae]MBC6164649.1 hypothetical protein [Listeria booriae]